MDVNGDGKGDQLQIFEGGVVARVEVDSNGDGVPDVVQYLSGQSVVRQCQDDDFDGHVDSCFEGQTPVPLGGVLDLAKPLGNLGCGSFHRFWSKR